MERATNSDIMAISMLNSIMEISMLNNQIKPNKSEKK